MKISIFCVISAQTFRLRIEFCPNREKSVSSFDAYFEKFRTKFKNHSSFIFRFLPFLFNNNQSFLVDFRRSLSQTRRSLSRPCFFE